MRILALSDVESKSLWDFYSPDKLKDIDLIISCGDLKSEYLSFLVTLTNIPLFYVHGNHDKQYKIKPPLGCDSIDGDLVNYKGVRILGLGGSMKYSLGPHQYTDKQMDARIRKLKLKLKKNDGFDILVTHAPAYTLGDGNDLCHKGFTGFNKLIDKFSPKYFLHGHNHINYGNCERIIKYKDTTIINAYNYCILDTEKGTISAR